MPSKVRFTTCTNNKNPIFSALFHAFSHYHFHLKKVISLVRWTGAAVYLPQWIFWFCIGGLFFKPSFAQENLTARLPFSADFCTAQPVYPLDSNVIALQKLLDQIDGIAPLCLQSGPFHAWRGAVLWALNQPSSAAESLERALLLNPEQPGAQLDYAQVLMALGDKASARDLLAQIASRADVPAALQPLLARELAGLDNAQTWRTRWILTSALGLDSNLNNAPAASELTLTFGQDNVTLPLAKESRPQSGPSFLGIVQWQGLKPQGRQLWVLQAEIRARHTAQNATRYQQADVSASWLEAPEASSQWIVRAGLGRIDFGGQPLLQSARIGVTRQWQSAAPPVPGITSSMVCRPSAGVEYEPKRYPGTTNLNANYVGWMAALNCALRVPGAGLDTPTGNELSFFPEQAGVQLRVGHDQAVHESRPGGNQRRMELRTTWESRLGPFRANADYSFTRQSDGLGYSPLLENNAVRSIRRHSVRLELSESLAKYGLTGTDWFASFEINQQFSNLQAFVNRQKVLYVGVRWALQ